MSSASKHSQFVLNIMLFKAEGQIKSGVTNWKTAISVFTAIITSTFPVVFLI